MLWRLMFALPLTACALAFAADAVPTGSSADTAETEEACDAGDCDAEALRRFDLPEAPAPMVPYADGLLFADLAETDVRGAYHTIEQVRHDLAALDPADRALAAASMQELVVTCAYTRASVQLPVALHQLVMSLEPSHVVPLVDRDVAYLQRGLAAHVAVLDTLGVAGLSSPKPGDALFGLGGPGTMVDRATLESGGHPVEATAVLVQAIPNGLQEGGVLDRIRWHTEQVERVTDHPWTLMPHTRGWHRALRRLEPFVVNPEQQQRVREAIELLDDYAGRGC